MGGLGERDRGGGIEREMGRDWEGEIGGGEREMGGGLGERDGGGIEREMGRDWEREIGGVGL